MTEPTKEQQQVFWEWCGFKHGVPELARQLLKIKNRQYINVSTTYPEKFLKEQWYIPGVYCGEMPDVDLDNLVTYAVPKVICTDGYSLHLIYNVSHCEAHIQPHYAELKFYSASDKDLAHALFWVLDQVRQDEEVKDNGK